jgi:hypothetical protein
MVLSHLVGTVGVSAGGAMCQKYPNTKSCLSWTTEEIEELRSSLQSNDIAAVDTAKFGKRFSEIVLRGRSANSRSRGNGTSKQNKSGSAL